VSEAPALSMSAHCWLVWDRVARAVIEVDRWLRAADTAGMTFAFAAVMMRPCPGV